MYPVLADKINSCACRRGEKEIPKGMYTWDIFEMATSGEPIPIDKAISIRDLYFPGEPLEVLFERNDDSSALTVAEAGRIMQSTMPGDVMGEMQNAVHVYVNAKVASFPLTRGARYAMGWCLAIGRAAGVREERTRRRGEAGGA